MITFQHEFIQNAKPVETLQKMIVEAKEIQEEQTYNMNGNDSVSSITLYLYSLC